MFFICEVNRGFFFYFEGDVSGLKRGWVVGFFLFSFVKGPKCFKVSVYGFL